MVAALAVVLVGYLLASGLVARHGAGRDRAEVRAASAATRATDARVARTFGVLRLLAGQTRADRSTLSSDTARLAMDRAGLVHQQSVLATLGFELGLLDNCLNGAQQAVNQLSLHDSSGAMASVQAVTATCRSAAAAGTGGAGGSAGSAASGG